MSDEDVKVYLLDRAGDSANAFAAKLKGREGVQLTGGTEDVDEALEEIGNAAPDVILVGTDLGGSGVVAAIERVLAVAPDVAVVALSTAADKALVAQSVRSGAAGSLDRTASPGETITALHVYMRRQQGDEVDMSLAEPPGESTGIRVSGALPNFPGPPPEVYQPGSLGRHQAPETEGLPQAGEMPGEVGGHEDAATPPPQPLPGSMEVGELEPHDSADEADEAVAQLREMLRQEAHAASQPRQKRGFLGLFGGGKEKNDKKKNDKTKSGWGPKNEGKEEETDS